MRILNGAGKFREFKTVFIYVYFDEASVVWAGIFGCFLVKTFHKNKPCIFRFIIGSKVIDLFFRVKMFARSLSILVFLTLSVSSLISISIQISITCI